MYSQNYVPLQPQPLTGGAPDPDVPLWLGQHGNMQGAGLVLFLHANPDQFYHVQNLTDIVFGGGILLQTDLHNFGRLYEEKIPMTDPDTVARCKKELPLLIKQIEGATWLGYADRAQTLQRRFESIRKYLLETTTPSGRIRSFPSQEMREYQRVFKAFWRLLQKARAESPEVYSIIKKHVQTGTTFAWLSDIRKLAGKKFKAERAMAGLGTGSYDL